MPHVSQQKVNKKIFEELQIELQKLIAQTKEADTASILGELLTDTERTMLAKRLMAAILFEQGYSQYQVWSLLKISPSTATRFQLQYQNGGYEKSLRVIKNYNASNFNNLLEKIVRGGMPSRGKRRWTTLADK